MAIGDLQLPLYPWGSLAPMMTPMAKAQSNVTASNIPGAKIPGPYDFLNAMTSLSNVQGENALRQQQMLLTNQNMEMLKQKLSMMPEFMKLFQGGGEAQSGNATGMQPTGAAQPQTAAAPATTGDPLDQYADKVIGVESGGNPNAKNPRSSATGLGQFTDSTWLDLAKKSFPQAASMGDDALLALRTDPQVSRDMVKAYGRENAPMLAEAGAPITPGNLYLAHFLGPGGAKSVLTADPSTPLAGLVGESAIKANPFLKGKTAGDLATWATEKMGGGAPDTVENAPPTQPVRMAQNGPMPSLAGNLPPQGTMPLGASAAPQMPMQMPGSLAPLKIGGKTPEQWARIGAMGEMLGMPNIAAPMMAAGQMDPNFKYQQGLAEALSKLPTAELAARLGAIGKNAVTPEQVRTGSQQTLPVYDAQGNVTGVRQLNYNPALPQGMTQERLPNGQIVATRVPGTLPAIQENSTATAAGPAAFKQEDINGPYGQNFRTTALNAAAMLGSGQGAATVAPTAPGGGGLAVGGAMPGAAQSAPTPAAQSATPQRPYAAAPTFPVPMAGGKDLDQLSVNDMFAAGLHPTEPPKPPSGATYGPASAGLTELQKKDADRVEGYGREAAENQKAYQDLGHLGDILDHGMNTGKLTPLWADLNNIARSLGAPEIFPTNPESQAAFEKATTDLVFAAVKKMGGRVLVSEIEGFQKANPTSVLPTAANRSIISDILAAGKWQDARARLAQQYLTGTGGAPLADFEAQFNRMAPLDSVSNNYRNTFRQAGWKFPEDTNKSTPPAGPQIIQHGGNSYLKTPDGTFYPIHP